MPNPEDEILDSYYERIDYISSYSPAVFYICKWSGSLEVVFVSKNISDQLGFEPSELIGPASLWEKQIHPEDRERVAEEIQKLSHSNEAQIEYRMQKKNSEYIWIKDYIKMIYNEIGEPSELFGFFVNANAEVLAKKELEMEKEKLQTIVDNIPVCLAYFNSAGKFDWVNKEWSRVMGWTLEETKTNDIIALTLDSPDRERVAQHMQRADSSWLDVRGKNKNGKLTETTWANLRLSNGKFLGLGQDITARKELEKAILENTEFLNGIVENIPVVLFCKDVRKGFRFTVWNKMAESLLGFSAQDVLGKTDYNCFPGEMADFFRMKDLEVIAGGRIFEVPEETVNTKNGEQRILHTLKVPIFDSHTGEPIYLLGISEDITERKMAQDKAIHAAKMAALGEMASGIGHEINNPIAIIHLKAQKMITKLSQEASQNPLVKDLQTISEMALRVSDIVKAMRSLSREESVDEKMEVLAQEILKDVFVVCEEKFLHADVSLTWIKSPDSLRLLCHPGQVSQIILNLLANALDAAQTTPQKWVRLSAEKKEKHLEISVMDSGLGIPVHLRSKIMQPFFTTKEPGRGTGLGLSLSCQMAEKNGGELFYDADSPNTRFVARFPLLA